ncbi:unnamed protein product [Ambrosiozyma monospora]|uniref:Unnamed protein product n=1 Tax=Ambrosiozyma monospora TaxID=43982 RepID=A0ACB5U7P6_AMBMO|nr:unnamed protein product [Ambrosiozyma monospora]
MSASSQDPVINDILRKIERERNLALGINNLRKETNNASVIQRCNTQIRETQKNIEYLEQTLRKLTLAQSSAGGSSSGQDSDNNSGLNSSDTLSPQNSNNNNSLQNPRTRPNAAVHKPTFTILDLMKYECPSLGHRIQYMLQQLEFKIQVEEQYKEANEKIYKLYQMDGDRRSIAMAEDGRNDGNRRIQLMKRSLKQYQSLFIDMDDVARENAVINTFRKTPLTGKSRVVCCYQD